MKKLHLLCSLILLLGISNIARGQAVDVNEKVKTDSIIRIDMNLSAFGVESDSFPSIKVKIDFYKEYSICKKSFTNPSIKGSTYRLTEQQMADILSLLKISDLEILKESYSSNWTDQPSSKTVIHTRLKNYVINDYGLKAPSPLQELYKIVYRIR